MTKRGVFAAVALIVLFILTLANVKAHEAPSGWAYPMECCSNQDCAPLDARLVTESEAGFAIAASAGGGFVARGTERRAPDGEYHLCRSTISQTILCFFVPPRGS